jgi:hypothetical protein
MYLIEAGTVWCFTVERAIPFCRERAAGNVVHASAFSISLGDDIYDISNFSNGDYAGLLLKAERRHEANTRIGRLGSRVLLDEHRQAR